MNYHNITHDDMLNGKGFRVVLWVAGCSHHCKGCHNSETWNPNSGILFDDSAKEEIYNELKKDYVQGITFSGGDPLFPGNRDEISKLIKDIKEKFPQKNIWLYTGFVYDQVKDLEVMNYIDVLVDGPFIIELKSPEKHWVGSSNQRVIDLQKTKRSGQLCLLDE